MEISARVESNEELSMTGSPSKAAFKRALEEAEDIIAKSNKKIKTLQQTKRRYKKRLENLHSLLSTLQSKRYLDDDVAKILGAAAGPTSELFDRFLSKSVGATSKKKFPPELRAFALTLHFYSPRAYTFVRKSFNLCLPHPRTLTKWYQHINGTPGFTTESFVTVENKIKESAYDLLFCLSFDEMAIRRHVEFDGKTFHGYVNMGVEIEDDVLPIAKDSSVFLLVCINEQWKIPLGYFLIDSLSSSQTANLVRKCLSLFNSINAKVVGLTFDGLASNVSMATNLGCTMDPYNLKTVFPHPDSKEDIRIFMDPSHMLKLVRNTLGEKKSIVDSSNNLIEWRYIKELHNLQENEGLHLANKLRSLHVNFAKKTMKVSLAAQVLSKSVADALEYCETNLNLEQFQGCRATVKFLRMFNDLFDILNSRNLQQYGWKKPVNKKKYLQTVIKLKEVEAYIHGLKESCNGNFILKTNRKTGFLGFLVCIHSVLNAVDHLIMSESAQLIYLPTYKLSQNHIELLFARIRLLGSCNNNLTARQFMSAYKKLLIKSQLSESYTGNCLPLSSVSILYVSSTKQAPEDIINMTSNIRLTQESPQTMVEPPDHDYMFSPTALSICSERIVYYIAGYVSRKLASKIKCQPCISALYSPCVQNNTFVCFKSNGHLIYPSDDVFFICKRCESHFRKCVNLSGGQILKHQYNMMRNTSEILQMLLNENLFHSLENHMNDTEPMDNHFIHLVKAVIENYLHIRFMYFSKTVVDNSKSVRKVYTKLMLFKGQ